MKKNLFRSLLPYLILDALGLILFIVLLSLGLWQSALVVLLGTVLAQGIAASFLLSEKALQKMTKPRALFYIFGRLFFLLAAVIFPILLWYYGKGFQETVNVGFLFYSPAFCYAEYVITFLQSLFQSRASSQSKQS